METQEEEVQKTSIKLVLTGLVLSITSLIIFGALAEDILENETFTMDSVIIEWLHSFNSSTTNDIMFWITQSGSVRTLTVFSLLVIYWLYNKKRDISSIIFFIITVAGGGLLNVVLKLTFQRNRPSLDTFVDAVGYSFPSGHSMGSMIFYGFIGYLVISSQRSRTTKFISTILLSLFILMIGVSRVYLNAHYPSDVLAGYTAGLIWLIMCIYASKTYKRGFGIRRFLRLKN